MINSTLETPETENSNYEILVILNQLNNEGAGTALTLNQMKIAQCITPQGFIGHIDSDNTN